MMLPFTTLLMIVVSIATAHLVIHMALRALHRYSNKAVVPAAFDMRFVAGAMDQKSSALRGWHLELEYDSRDMSGRRISRPHGQMLMIERRLPFQLVNIR